MVNRLNNCLGREVDSREASRGVATLFALQIGGGKAPGWPGARLRLAFMVGKRPMTGDRHPSQTVAPRYSERWDGCLPAGYIVYRAVAALAIGFGSPVLSVS